MLSVSLPLHRIFFNKIGKFHFETVQMFDWCVYGKHIALKLKKNYIKFRSFRALKITYVIFHPIHVNYSYTCMYTQLYSSTSRTQNVHHFSYHLFMCPGFAVIYRKYMRGFVKPKRLNERGETCQAQMIS